MPSGGHPPQLSLIAVHSRGARAPDGCPGDARERADHAEQFLCGRFADRSGRHGAHRARTAYAPRAPEEAPHAAPSPAERTTSIRSALHPAARSDRCACFASRLAPDASDGPPTAEHPHALVADARVRLGKARVDQVVHGHTLRKRPHKRRGARRLCTRSTAARTPSRQQASARRAPTAPCCGRSPAPAGSSSPQGPSFAAAASPVDERGEAHPGGRLGERAGISSRADTSMPPVSPGRGRQVSGRRALCGLRLAMPAAR